MAFGDTPNHSNAPLCATCRFAGRVQGLRVSEELTFCSRMPRPHQLVTIRVVDCSWYDDKRLVPLYTYSQQAWDMVDLGDGEKTFWSQDEQLRRHILRERAEEAAKAAGAPAPAEPEPVVIKQGADLAAPWEKP